MTDKLTSTGANCYGEYLKAVIESYPDMRADKWNKVDLVREVAEMLFIDGEIHTNLAVETRRQLKSLRDNGVHCFDARLDKEEENQ